MTQDAGGTPGLPGIPGTRAARHALIELLLDREAVGSQGELAAALAVRGVSVTQGTLSRDLDALGAVKVRGADGALVYRLPDRPAAPLQGADTEGPSDERLRRWCGDLLLAGDRAGHTLVLRTPPGAASMLAAALDDAGLAGVLGCVAGDDTIVVITRDDERAPVLLDHLLTLADSGRRTTHD